MMGAQINYTAGGIMATERDPSPHRDDYRLNLETWFRGSTLLLVVVAVVVYPMYALIVHIPAATLAQVIAPVTGIAGAIVGYWFGQAQRRAQPQPGATPSPPDN
jgi:hypothetical protein